MNDKEDFELYDYFVIDAEIFLTGKKYRYDRSFMERKIRPVKDQVKLGKEVSQRFYIECAQRKRYSYPLNTIFRLRVTVLKKSNKTAFYDYYDEYYL